MIVRHDLTYKTNTLNFHKNTYIILRNNAKNTYSSGLNKIYVLKSCVKIIN